MPDREQGFVIVGGGLAGAKAAQTLREEGYEGPVTLIGEELAWRPYERPPLSKGVLLGKEPPEKALVFPDGWEHEHEVTLLLGTTVVSIDRSAHQVALHEDSRIPYDRLLLTTGASARRLDVPGTTLPSVHYLRTMGESLALREALAPGDKRVVVIGAGWIGLEVAAAARSYGNDVTIVEPEAAPIYRAVGAELGEIFAELHRSHGVELLLGEGANAVREGSVLTGGDRELPADVVIIGIGAQPNSGLAQEAGLEVDNGIVVDAALRTSDPDIFAAGDVANAYHPLLKTHIRVEHWANALNGGPAAARSMLGQEVSYDRIPYFFTDQYDLGMEFSGVAAPGDYDEVVFRGDVKGLEFIAFWLAGDRVVAGMNVNVWDVADDIQALIRSGAAVDRDRLTDTAVPLTELR